MYDYFEPKLADGPINVALDRLVERDVDRPVRQLGLEVVVHRSLPLSGCRPR